MSVGTRTDYANFQQKYIEENALMNNYLQAINLKGIEHSLQDQIASAQTQKNISNAYSNYLHHEMALKHTNDMTASGKQYFQQRLAYDTNKAVSAYKQEDVGKKQALEQQKQTDINTIKNQYYTDLQKQATEFGERAVNIEKGITDLMFSRYQDNPAYSDIFQLDANNKLMGLSNKGKDMFFGADGKLTDVGKKWFSEGLYYYDSVARHQLSAEEYDNYINDRLSLNEMFTGDKLNPYDPTQTELDTNIHAASVKHDLNAGTLQGSANEYFGNVGDSDDIGKLFDMTWSLDTTKRTASSLNDETLLGNMMSDNRGDWSVTDFTEHTGITTYELKEGSKTYDKYVKTVAGLQKLKDSGKLKKGDIVEYDGYLAYFNGETFKLAKDTSELRNKLGSK